MRLIKIVLFVVAFLAVWGLALGVAAGMGNGASSDTAMVVTSLIVLIPFLWLGRRLFRGEGNRRVSRIEEAAAAATATAVGVAHTLPTVADDMAANGDTVDISDTDVD